MSIEPQQIRNIIEAALFAADHPLSIDALVKLFDEEQAPAREEIRSALEELAEEYAKRGIELREVSSGYRFQVQQNFAPWVSRLWEERPPRYSRALLETLALVAYRQPITRAEIEDIRGVSVSSHIMKTLQERNWVKVVGHRDVPGKPAMYATTREFLDYFNMKSLEELPTLAEIRDLDQINAELELKEAADQETLTQTDQETMAEETAENLELSFGEEATVEPVETDTPDTPSNETAQLESERSAVEISSDESQTVSGAYIIGDAVDSDFDSGIELQEEAENVNTAEDGAVAVNASLEHDVNEEPAEDSTLDQTQDESFSQPSDTHESDESNEVIAQHDSPVAPAAQDNDDEESSLIESRYESGEPVNDDQSDAKSEQEHGEIKKFSPVDSDEPVVEQDSLADRMSSEKSAFN